MKSNGKSGYHRQNRCTERCRHRGSGKKRGLRWHQSEGFHPAAHISYAWWQFLQKSPAAAYLPEVVLTSGQGNGRWAVAVRVVNKTRTLGSD